MAAGEHLLSEEQKTDKKILAKKIEGKKKHAIKQEKRAQSFVPPKVLFSLCNRTQIYFFLGGK